MVVSQTTSITPANHADTHRHGGTDPLSGDIRSTYVDAHGVDHIMDGADEVSQNPIMRMVPSQDIVVGAVGDLYNLLLPCDAVVSVGGWSISENAVVFCNLGIHNTTSGPSNLDAIYWDVWIDAGTYDVALWCRESTSYAILDIDIDGVEATSFDCYDGSTLSSKLTSTGIAVATSGYKRVTARIDGKNGSSSSYNMFISALGFRRTV